jgi:cytochrome c oxidase subunit II
LNNCKLLTSIYLIAACGPLIQSCASMPASLDPQSSAAGQITFLWWVMFWAGTIIWVVVTLLLLIGLFRRQGKAEAYIPLRAEEHDRSVNRWIVGGGIVMPTIVLIGLIALTVGALRRIPTTVSSAAITIEVTGHQWWWEIHYPDQDITLRDEMHIPAGQPIEVRLTSADVIHSFWVPELHGKFDLIPGRTHVFVLQADQPGEYPGRCAEFCGLRHARMTFTVVAMPPEEFTVWLDSHPRSVVDLKQEPSTSLHE